MISFMVAEVIAQVLVCLYIENIYFILSTSLYWTAVIIEYLFSYLHFLRPKILKYEDNRNVVWYSFNKQM